MTRNQKWLKGLVGGDPKPKTVARWWKRGSEYRAQFAVAHGTKRQALLKKRQDAERAAEAAAKAAKKGAR